MIRALGQAARGAAWLLHHTIQILLAAFILAIIGVGALAVRLSQGPLEIPWIAHVLEAAATADGPTRLTIGHAELAWEGWRLGLDRPLDLRLTDIAAVAPGGARLARLPRAELSVSFGWLLLGRLVPRALEVDGARLLVARATDGAVSLDLGSLVDQSPTSPAPEAGGLSVFLRDLTQPAQTDANTRAALSSRWAQLRRVRIHDAEITVNDHQLGLTWRVQRLDLDLLRPQAGGVAGSGHAEAAIGGQTLGVSLQATLPGDTAAATTLAAQVTPFVPARFASMAKLFAPLAAIDAPVTLSATASLGRDLMPVGGGVRVHLDAGQARINAAAVPFLGADLETRIGGGQITATLTRLVLAPRVDGPRTTVGGSATLRREGDHVAAKVEVTLDQVAFADLPVLWPAGVGGPGTRPWIVTNLTAGTARDAKFAVALSMPPSLSDVSLTAISGGFTGQDVTVSWLRPVPPIEHGTARLSFAGPDVIDIAVLGGRQAGGTQGGIMVRGGRLHITGISAKDQFADIDADLAGPLADVVTLLRNPKIRLLDRRPIEMRDPSGQYAGTVSITRLPLETNLTMDDLRIHTVSHLTDVHLGGTAAGRDIDHGMLDLDAGNDGLHVKGTAQIATIPSQLTVDMDFRDGPPSQVLTRVAVNATADEKQLAGIGADPGGVLTGSVGVRATLAERRDGRGDVAIHADLAHAALAQKRFGLSKPVGAAASGDAAIVLDHDRLASIARVSLVGDGILVQGSADVVGGRPNVLRLERVKLGATTDLHGEVGLPARPGDAYRVSLEGPTVDVSREFGHADASAKPAAAPPDQARAGPPYLVDVRFDRVVAANGQVFQAVSAHLDNDGRILRAAQVRGRTGEAGPFSVAVSRDGDGRQMRADAADLGALLRGLDVADNIDAGSLSLTGRFDDRTAAHKLSGRLDVAAFRVRGAPVLGKILQGMTLYGLLDALSGPGLNFTRLVTQFGYANDGLELTEARAFSASLGMTAKGSIDLAHRRMDVDGTVVPAYFFNSLLGGIPLVGKLFSPEQGGGLFAVRYWVRGPFDDPSVGVNPLSALTPGFLRGVFGVFDETGK